MYAPMIENTRYVGDAPRSQSFDDAQAEVKVLRSLKTCPEAPRRPEFLCGVNGKMPCKTGPGIKIRTKDRCAANPTAVQLVFVRVHQPQIRPLPYKRRHLAQGVARQQIIMVKKAGPGGINQLQCGIGGTGNVPVFFPQHEAQPFVISGVATQNFRNFTFCGGIISNAEMPMRIFLRQHRVQSCAQMVWFGIIDGHDHSYGGPVGSCVQPIELDAVGRAVLSFLQCGFSQLHPGVKRGRAVVEAAVVNALRLQCPHARMQMFTLKPFRHVQPLPCIPYQRRHIVAAAAIQKIPGRGDIPGMRVRQAHRQVAAHLHGLDAPMGRQGV